MKKVIVIIAIILILAGVGCFFVWQKVSSFFSLPQTKDSPAGQQEQQIQTMIDERRKQSLNSDNKHRVTLVSQDNTSNPRCV